MFNYAMNYTKIIFLSLSKYGTYNNTRVFGVPWKAGGISWGDIRITKGCPKYRGTCWNTKLLSESTTMKNGFRVKGYRSPGYKLQQEQKKINHIPLQVLSVTAKVKDTCFLLTSVFPSAGLLSCLDGLIPFCCLSEHHQGHSPLFNTQ